MMTAVFVFLAFCFWLFAMWGVAHKRPIIFSMSWLITAAPIGALLFFIWLFFSESISQSFTISHSFTEVLQLIAFFLLAIAGFTFRIWRLTRGYFIAGVTEAYLLRALSSATGSLKPPLTGPLPWLLITKPSYGSCRLILRDRQYKSEFQQLVRAIDAYFIEMPDEVNNTPYVFQFFAGFAMLICAFVFAS